MHVVVEFVEAKPQHIATVRAALLMLARQSLDERRCRQIEVSADPLEPTGFLVYRVYDDEAAYNNHVATPEHEALALTLAPWLASRRVLVYDLISGHGQA
jgi:quinol monooxygenase YgiN